ncbi:MAG: succinyl-diaminopimelate desuccinylase, partial [Thermoleophilia bacterium]|nr:succinyl-diaminopimelate desuccinylase [Thermoleophilia bacterium]
MVELARWLAEEKPPLALDLGLLFFPREELPAEESALPALFAAPSAIHEADLVVVLEPTDNSIQAGCLGNLNAGLTWRGRSAHSARPWLGENAIERAVLGLAAVLPIAERVVEIDGLRFVEVASATAIAGGIAPNVIPAEASCLVNFRYAPDRSPQEAEAWARELAGAVGAELALAGNSPAAPVLVDAPLVQRLRRAGSFEVEAKQAWTPVAEFAAAGLDAVNLGPGATRYAHTRDEQVPIRELERTFEAFARFFAGDE